MVKYIYWIYPNVFQTLMNAPVGHVKMESVVRTWICISVTALIPDTWVPNAKPVNTTFKSDYLPCLFL